MFYFIYINPNMYFLGVVIRFFQKKHPREDLGAIFYKIYGMILLKIDNGYLYKTSKMLN